MISINITGISEVKTMLSAYPKQAGRAAEMALDATAKAIRDEIKATMPKVFDRPVSYTINSLKITPTYNHNMIATVWFKDPDRMGQHYLVPQVEGGPRKLKGFERGVALGQLVPTRVGAQVDANGNMSVGQIRQIVSVLGLGDKYAGVTSNMTIRSATRNKNQRDYLIINRGNKSGLLPGVYQRTPKIGSGIDKVTSRRMGITGAKAYQYGKSIGKWRSIVRARGLRPVLLAGRTGSAVKPLLPFYTIAHDVFDKRFVGLFWSNLARLLP